jgi:HAD superfamily hydrolase (TIGR01509 family)
MVRVIRAVIFDLDGVLIDSEPVWERVRRAYVAAAGGRWQPDSQRRLMGMSTDEWADYLSRDLSVGRPSTVVAREVIDRMAEQYAAAVPLLPSAVSIVRDLSGRYRLGLASSSPRRLVDEVLADAGLTDAFAATRSTDEVRHGKPAPDVYLSVAAALGIEPADCVAVEDSSNGVRSAAAAGTIVVAVPRPAYPLDDDAIAGAAVVLPSLVEVPGTIGELDRRAR